MKTQTVAITAVIMTALTGTAPGLQGGSAGLGISVCTEVPVDSVLVYLAKRQATQMFAEVGVNLEWHSWNNCPPGAIRISIREKTEAMDHPGALGYALPYEGTHIVVLLDRMQAAAQKRALPHLLAHVYVHEIAHILEGSARHSDNGVLKARFTMDDILQLEMHPLPFASVDVGLIHAGIERRQGVMNAGNGTSLFSTTVATD
jgi:hypothetical protein